MKRMYIKPYTNNTASGHIFVEMYARHILNEKGFVFIYKYSKQNKYGICLSPVFRKAKKIDKEFQLLDEAKQVLDQFLIENDCILLTQEQVDKISILI